MGQRITNLRKVERFFLVLQQLKILHLDILAHEDVDMKRNSKYHPLLEAAGASGATASS
jgi:hypothetical protein